MKSLRTRLDMLDGSETDAGAGEALDRAWAARVVDERSQRVDAHACRPNSPYKAAQQHDGLPIPAGNQRATLPKVSTLPKGYGSTG